MILNSIDDIKSNYGFDNTRLLMHYIAIAGEVSSLFYEKLNIKKDNKNYILYKSKYKDSFVTKKKNGLCGFQLNSRGILNFINNENMQFYADYVFAPAGSLRKMTNDVKRRRRYQNMAELLLACDKVGIDYLNFNTSCYFLPANNLKNLLSEKQRELGISNEAYAIKSSRMYGVLCIENELYIMYMFPQKISNLDYQTELRNNTIVNVSLGGKIGVNRAVVFTTSIESQEDIVADLFYCRKKKNEKYNNKRFKIYKERLFNNLMVISLEDQGLKELQYLIYKKTVEEKLKSLLLEKQRIRDKPGFPGIMCDMNLNGFPLFFLIVIDVNKIIYIYDLISSRKDVGAYIVCFKEHVNFVSSFFYNYKNQIKVVAYEDIINL